MFFVSYENERNSCSALDIGDMHELKKIIKNNKFNFYLFILTLYIFQGRLDAIDTDKAVEFVLSCMNFDGGFGCRPGSESHAGQVLPHLRQLGNVCNILYEIFKRQNKKRKSKT